MFTKHRRASPNNRTKTLRPFAVDGLESRVLFSAIEYSETGVPLSWTNSAAPMLLPGGTIGPQGDPADPPVWLSRGESLMNLDDFRADGRFGALDGTGYAAVIIDSGIDRNHGFFGADANRNGVSDRVVYSYDFADNDSDASAADNHGSNVTSIIASSDNNYPGIAPGVNIIHLKVFSDEGDGQFGFTERALRWVVTNGRRYNVLTVNLSLGDFENHASAMQGYGIADELTALAGMNIIVTAAAGNDFAEFRSTQGLAYPAADPSVIAVGAVYTHNFGAYGYEGGARVSRTGADRVAVFSQRTTSIPMIFAPGAPITGASRDGGIDTMHGTSQAAPHVAGAAVLIQQLSERLFGARLTLAEFRSLMYSSAETIVDGDDERDSVRNTGAAFKRLDVFAMAQKLWRRAGAEVSLRLATTAVVDGATTTLSFGTSTVNLSIAKTFTVENTGAKRLRLSNLRVPDGYSVVSSFGDGTLAPNQVTTFTIQLDAAAAGDFRGEVTFNTNDASERQFSFKVAGAARSTSIKLDDGAPGVSTEGAWTVNRAGYSGDSRVKNPGGGLATVSWAFTKLLPGQYRVWTTWKPEATLASNAPYLVDHGRNISTVLVDQRRAPDDLAESGTNWETLGSFLVDDGRLTITLNDWADGRVVGDAVRIERIDNLPDEARLHVSYNTTAIVHDDRPLSFGSTPSGRPIVRTFTLRNAGELALSLEGVLELPEGFELVSTLPASIPAGTSTSITLRVPAGRPGTYTGAVVIGTSDTSQPSFKLNVSAVVSPVVTYLDDGDSGFNHYGAWVRERPGYRGDQLSASPGASAQWTFGRLTAGLYRISATWVARSTATGAAAYGYEATGGLRTTVTVDQRITPNSDRSVNTWWQHLGEVRIDAGDVLNIWLGALDGLAHADAIRVERIDN